ncbi:MAG: hypothetical protein ACO36B_06385 [Methylophilaceae bacterium]
MSLVNFTNLDFDQIKTSIRDYLRSNSNFTDYDFEGSNMSVIIDMLAYNTYISSYNANMVSNEVFIDSATLRENIVALARNIGYIPGSRKAAKANISFFVEVSNPLTKLVTLKSGTVCNTSSFGRSSYVFSILDDITVPVVNGIAFFEGIEIYEGSYLNTNFTVNTLNSESNNQRFILENRGIDTRTLKVLVRDTQSSTTAKRFVNSTNILDVTSASKVFFLQEIEDERYELIFGDGVFGEKLTENNYIDVSYLISNGREGNGFSSFNFSGVLVDNNGTFVTGSVSLLTTNLTSSGGSDIESVNSIRNFAPRAYASQNRAVTASDYETLIPKIYSETESVSAFGGEELNPPQYGKVFITIKPIFGSFLSNTIKDNIKEELRKYAVAGIVPEILDLKYIYLELNSNVYYDTNSSLSADSIRSKVINNIEKYADSEELNKYGARFKYSKYQKLIDDSDASITSNITRLQMRRDLRISQNQFAEYEICFRNQFHIKNTLGYNIKSSGFKVSGISNTVYISDTPNSNNLTGSLFLFYLDSDTNPVIVNRSIGTVDYVNGEILLNPIKIISAEKTDGGTPIVEISAAPESNDVLGIQDLYLQIDTNKLEVNTIPDNIESGSDTSGSNYIISSSYLNGNLVRK